MKKILIVISLMVLISIRENPTFAAGIGDPGASLEKGRGSLGPEFSWVGREIRDREEVRYDTEAWRLFLKGSYGLLDWLEIFGRLGGETLKIRGTPFDSNLGIAAGGGLKGTFLDPPGHPLRYSVGGQLLYEQADNAGARARWFEYDIWLGTTYKGWKNLNPYGGIIYSRVDGKLEDFPSKPMLDEFKSPTAAGIFLGFDWQMKKSISLGMEFRGFSESSGTFSLRYCF